VILGGARTAIGRYGGSLSHVRTDDLLGLALNAAVVRAGVEPGYVEEIAAGCVSLAARLHTSTNLYDARASARAGAGSDPIFGGCANV
jgi:acetyl-CoA acetyltransferase